MNIGLVGKGKTLVHLGIEEKATGFAVKTGLYVRMHPGSGVGVAVVVQVRVNQRSTVYHGDDPVAGENQTSVNLRADELIAGDGYVATATAVLIGSVQEQHTLLRLQGNAPVGQ